MNASVRRHLPILKRNLPEEDFWAFVWCEEEIPSDNKSATRIYHGAYQGTVCGKRN